MEATKYSNKQQAGGGNYIYIYINILKFIY